ncbi:MAG TPA: transglycosylase domain-containing protein [Candidatus Nitrosotalea sp.]|nr:transglycosylase domain-containing protein [Candidatus Nitrosotalea sp.]
MSRPRNLWVKLGLLTAAVLTLVAAYPATALQGISTSRNGVESPQSIVIYDRTGGVLATRATGGGYHLVLPLSQIGATAENATLAAEDRGFFDHGPVDARSLIRAAVTDLFSGRPVEGGSTLTQQLIKLDLLAPQKSLTRKGLEAYLAWALERRYSKDQILAMYLNTVYYGRDSYGIGAAAKTYFGSNISPRQLTPAQAAFLAGLLQAPVTYDPVTNFAGARQRQLYVLGGMRDMHAISPATYAQAVRENIQGELKLGSSRTNDVIAPHFVDYVMQTLERQFGAAAVQRGGFSVYTTIDPALQRSADQAVKTGVQSLSNLGVNNGALLAVVPSTGEVLAWVGSADYNNAAIGGQFDVVLSPRQPGSSFKPYVYEAALRDQKIALCTTLHDVPTDFNGYRPLDFDNSYLGSLTAAQALVLSRNIPAIEVASQEGITNVIALARQMGITSPLDPSLPTAIGASAITMYEQTQGYQVFADQGRKVPLISITKIVNSSGKVVFQRQPGRQTGQAQVLTPAGSYLISNTLKAYQYQWGLGFNRQMASKSGTSGGSQMGVNPDSWLMAYNPAIVVAAWAGNTVANGAGSATRSFGVNVGSTISAGFINALPASYTRWYQQPSGLSQYDGVPILPNTQSLCSGPGPGAPGPPRAPKGKAKHGH